MIDASPILPPVGARIRAARCLRAGVAEATSTKICPGVSTAAKASALSIEAEPGVAPRRMSQRAARSAGLRTSVTPAAFARAWIRSA